MRDFDDHFLEDWHSNERNAKADRRTQGIRAVKETNESEMVFATLLYDDAAGAEKEDVLSWSLATSDTVLQKTVRYLLAQSGVELDSDDGPVFVIDALVEQPTKRDAVLLPCVCAMLGDSNPGWYGNIRGKSGASIAR